MNNWIEHSYKRCRVCNRPLSYKAELGIGIRCWEKKIKGCFEHGKVPFWWEGGNLFIKCKSCAKENNNDGVKLVWSGRKRSVYNYKTNKKYYLDYYQKNKNNII